MGAEDEGKLTKHAPNTNLEFMRTALSHLSARSGHGPATPRPHGGEGVIGRGGVVGTSSSFFGSGVQGLGGVVGIACIAFIRRRLFFIAFIALMACSAFIPLMVLAMPRMMATIAFSRRLRPRCGLGGLAVDDTDDGDEAVAKRRARGRQGEPCACPLGTDDGDEAKRSNVAMKTQLANNARLLRCPCTHVPYWRVNKPTLRDICVSRIRRK